MPRKQTFVPLKSYKPITSERHARKATSDFHDGEGNRTTYQAASALLTDLHKTTSKFVFRTITKLGLRPRAGEAKLETFEVGAVNTQLLESSFLQVTAIDLKSRHPRIREADFFTVEPHGQFDVLVLAMVLNCVPQPEKRGEMLLKCRQHLKDGGLLFLILPSRCFPHNKREVFERTVMNKLGFEALEKESTPKVFSTCFRAANEIDAGALPDITFSDGNGLLDTSFKAKVPEPSIKLQSKLLHPSDKAGARAESTNGRSKQISSNKRPKLSEGID